MLPHHHPYLRRPLCPLFNRLFVIYVVGLSRYLEPLQQNIIYSEAAVCCTQMVPTVISILKSKALIPLPNLSFLWLQNTELQIVMNKIDVFTGSIKYSGAQQFNPFQFDSYCWVHSLRWGHLVIGTMNSIQIFPLQMGYYMVELVEIKICRNAAEHSICLSGWSRTES